MTQGFYFFSFFFSSVRSSNSHPDLLVIQQHHPLFQITPVLNTGLSLSEPLQVYQKQSLDCWLHVYLMCSARQCKIVQDSARQCKIVQDSARQCNIVQDSAIPCNTMQYHAIPSNTIQYHASLTTADGAYHCPVGSIRPFFFLYLLEIRKTDDSLSDNWSVRRQSFAKCFIVV